MDSPTWPSSDTLVSNVYFFATLGESTNEWFVFVNRGKLQGVKSIFSNFKM